MAFESGARLFPAGLFLDYVRFFVLFVADGDALIKKSASYHQSTACGNGAGDVDRLGDGGERAGEGRTGGVWPAGSRKAGVFWHTQGSGKSISMCCYAGKLLQQPEMNNPTLVVVTDRNDLDGQLYQQFCAAKDLLKQTPEQAESREQLREMLAARQYARNKVAKRTLSFNAALPRGRRGRLGCRTCRGRRRRA